MLFLDFTFGPRCSAGRRNQSRRGVLLSLSSGGPNVFSNAPRSYEILPPVVNAAQVLGRVKAAPCNPHPKKTAWRKTNQRSENIMAGSINMKNQCVGNQKSFLEWPPQLIVFS